MKRTLFTTGPYMNMLFDGMFVPVEEDAKIVWTNPAGTDLPLYCLISYAHLEIGTGKIPLIALEDVGLTSSQRYRESIHAKTIHCDELLSQTGLTGEILRHEQCEHSCSEEILVPMDEMEFGAIYIASCL
jgi:hypothetical protein